MGLLIMHYYHYYVYWFTFSEYNVCFSEQNITSPSGVTIACLNVHSSLFGSQPSKTVKYKNYQNIAIYQSIDLQIIDV